MQLSQVYEVGTCQIEKWAPDHMWWPYMFVSVRWTLSSEIWYSNLDTVKSFFVFLPL